MSRTRRLVGAVLVGAGAAAVARRRRRGTPAGAQAPGPTGRRRTVTTADGVPLAVEEFGPADAPVTVVLAHGFVQSSRLWLGQVADLLDGSGEVRVVVYDHRGHGDSGPARAADATISQLGADLRTVLDAVAPGGPVVLAGHSMGGMALLSFAGDSPELFGSRVVGVALVGTSAGELGTVTWGLPRPVAQVVRDRLLPAAMERARRLEQRGTPRKVAPYERFVLFGKGARREDVQLVLTDMARTSAATVADFAPCFDDHDALHAMPALHSVPVEVLVGDRDALCPVRFSRTMADAVPSARLTVLPGAGHMLMQERRIEVSDALLRLVDQARP